MKSPESSGLEAVDLRKEKHNRTLLALTSDGGKGTGTKRINCFTDLAMCQQAGVSTSWC